MAPEGAESAIKTTETEPPVAQRWIMRPAPGSAPAWLLETSLTSVEDGEIWLINANIPEYSHGNRLNHEPRRPRKLLLHTREI